MERRLAAVMAADMVGYSRLMKADEEGVLARQKHHRIGGGNVRFGSKADITGVELDVRYWAQSGHAGQL